MKFILITAGIACAVTLPSVVVAQTGSASAQTQANAEAQVGQRKASAEAKQETRVDARKQSRGQENQTQSHSATNASGSATPLKLEQGTQLQAMLKETLDSKKVSEGQQFLLKTTKDVKIGGEKVIRKGSTLVGHVVKGQSKAEGNGKAEMTLLIDGVQQGDQLIPLQAMFVGMVQTMAQAATATDFDSMPAMTSPTPRTGNGGGLLGGGLVGGVTSTVNTTVNATTQTVGQVGAVTNGSQGTLSATNGITQNGNVTGGLMALGQVLFTLQNGLTATTSSSVTGATDFARNGKDIKLEKGTEFVLAVTGSSNSSATRSR
jgi:hypothetical protein